MKRLILESWVLLLYFDCLMHIRGFGRIHDVVREEATHAKANRVDKEQVCRACDYACVFYFKRVMCLQRSAATAVLLRRHGWKAEMVIGAQLLPLQSHAWVEVEGCPVNDKPYMNEIFQVLERC